MMGQTMTKKTVKAQVNEPVFSYVNKGVYSAQIFGYEVLFERVVHNLWEVRVTQGVETGKLLAAAATRTKALIEAYNNIKRSEEKRLAWVLADQPLRVYGKRGEYKTDVDVPEKRRVAGDWLSEYNEPELQLVSDNGKARPARVREEEEGAEEPMSGKLSDFLTTEQKLRIRKFYKVRHNRLQGGFSLVKFDSKNIVEDVKGPFETAGKAYEAILEMEGVNIPEQDAE